MISTDGVLGLVQAGGKGSRMDVLTRERAKPALPFGGAYRLIDFALSSLTHSRIQDVWVAVQYQPSSLDRHVKGGRPWDLDRSRGGFRRIVPGTHTGSPVEDGFATGNADLLLRMFSELEKSAHDTVVVTSADHVFAMDLRPVIARHQEEGAVATLVTAEVTRAEAAASVTVLQKGSLATSFEVKRARPESTTAATEIFVYDKAVLLQTLDELRRRHAPDAEDGDSGLGDFGEQLLPALLQVGPVLTVPMDGYWRDLGRPDVYLRGHRELLAGKVDAIGRPGLPILTQPTDRPSAQIGRKGQVRDSILSPGCRVDGTVIGSVLGPGCVVEAGAEVVDSVLFDDVVVRAGARVAVTIADDRVDFWPGCAVGESVGRRLPADEEIALIGMDSRVGEGVDLPPGVRLEPGSTT